MKPQKIVSYCFEVNRSPGGVWKRSICCVCQCLWSHGYYMHFEVHFLSPLFIEWITKILWQTWRYSLRYSILHCRVSKKNLRVTSRALGSLHWGLSSSLIDGKCKTLARFCLGLNDGYDDGEFGVEQISSLGDRHRGILGTVKDDKLESETQNSFGF